MTNLRNIAPLRYFVTVAKNSTSARRHCACMTQPPLSQTIQALEQQLARRCSSVTGAAWR
jgi:DNA-binding transcriptional LysR family regulator